MRHTVDDLLALMAKLRDPQNGCPWDRAQSFSTIAPYTIEEAYEVVDAIEQEDYSALCSELGDLLLQVVYHAQMAKEESLFDFEQVVDGLYNKLLRRHPHLFGEEKATVPNQVNKLWEKVKQAERKEDAGLLDGISTHIPGLTRAVKLQKRAAQVGFDWTNYKQVIKKLHEEIAELEEAVESGCQDAVEDELGDLLFVCTNLARKLELDPEMAMRRANRKFESRFNKIESLLAARKIPLKNAGIDLLASCWDKAKEIERSEDSKETS